MLMMAMMSIMVLSTSITPSMMRPTDTTMSKVPAVQIITTVAIAANISAQKRLYKYSTMSGPQGITYEYIYYTVLL